MKLLDSRRLTGPNLLQERAGAVLDVALGPGEAEVAVAAWRERARALLDAVGWSSEETAIRHFPGGASLSLSAPLDALYAATEVNEEAWRAAEAAVAGPGGHPPPDLAEAAGRLRAEIDRERNPALLALQAAAEARGVAFLADHRHASVGLGAGSLTWRIGELPAPDQVPWEQVHDVPVVLVTGTNVKTGERLVPHYFPSQGVYKNE